MTRIGEACDSLMLSDFQRFVSHSHKCWNKCRNTDKCNISMYGSNKGRPNEYTILILEEIKYVKLLGKKCHEKWGPFIKGDFDVACEE